MLRSKLMLVLSLVAVVVMALGFASPAEAAKPDRMSIVDVALAANAEGPYAGQFDTLIAALGAAGLVGALDGNRQFTVFAPTDAAFEKLPEGTVDFLLLPENKQLLTSILLYHVAPGERLAADVIGSSRIRTLHGGFLFQSGGVLTDANGGTSNIIVTDIQADNGVIHVIDTVVQP